MKYVAGSQKPNNRPVDKATELHTYNKPFDNWTAPTSSLIV